ncbi:hypothetical protein A3H04_03730 [Candidatus Giovannonibacteria bacterium RIFCSPLOWO2_12_FULL_43_11c]|uniref:Uncharacterized protein n=1 Tax=Candidatus Giovannonibacteria bacterium RIFCSPHIGHO2_12_FULL_43_15 TaxID=1798341 RepID=A0A1F5WPF8_9BACT|nr:MAG: hypothetical protein A2739_00705 [Candidatus Giovannonibacteria bacterium RIFCSPHIGHO2_01_FULL_43_100]OGF66718.1 MAG: hypothetical protein A3B97_02285 [Candidatus Giovannonibacteria bacterium RIFCSPHIGHO2_02_FULL_43_32]OGF77494.1 MAG: hypothetical protein A3F23_00780 [Candidatus Giovannonibacteria bacterium RIFCSPHIGHO2_12_FULL_43_15]OGF78865.1 MAG: hypothetical protein A3A15_00180 [Candidatus Giovannonibacteria bacterium RIFCSPLOWO2_01_FULL_43_60]OGF92574.1 MAG: hypothetical protein A3
MTIGQLFGIFGASIVLVFFAKFFVGGEIFVWMFLFFFGSLYILHSAHVNSLISAASGATGKVYKAGKVFLMSVLVAIILVGFIQNLTGLAIGGTGEDKLTTLLYVALLGIFAMWQAGWTKGESGKVWVRRLFVLTLIYALFSAIFPSTQKAIGRFLADSNWLAESYGERKFVKEMKAAGKELKEDLLGEKDKTGGSPKTVTGPRLLPDGTVVPGERIHLSPGEEKMFSFQKSGVRFLGKGARVRIISASDAPTLVDMATGHKTTSTIIDVDEMTRQSPPWITCSDKCALRFIPETAVTLEARLLD